jgi:hypothetical protein
MGQSTSWSPHRGEPSLDGSADDRSLDFMLPLDGRRDFFKCEGGAGYGIDTSVEKRRVEEAIVAKPDTCKNVPEQS